MKKSLLITYYFPPYTGGISNSLYNFSKQFPADKIVVLTNRKLNVKEGFKIIAKNILIKKILFWPKWLPLVFHAYRTVYKEKIDLIQVGQVIPIGYVALLLKKILKIPYIVYIYGQDLIISRQSIRKSKLIKKILNNSDGIIANSNFTKSLAEDFGISTKIIVAYPCPQSVDLTVDKNKLATFKKNNYLENKKVILTVGNLVKRKGQDKVIKAINELNKDVNNYRYLIVGRGPYKDELVKLVNKFNLNDSISFHENVLDKELKYFYSACDVFIMASRILINNQNLPVDIEGFGMVFLEANLFKKPVIGGSNGGQSDAIEDCKSGLLVNATQVDEIVKAIKKLADNNGISASLGEYGYHRALKQFTWENQTQKIISFIKSLDLI